MKNTLLLLLLFFSFVAGKSQVTIKETSFKKGEVLVQLADGYTVKDVITPFPSIFNMHAVKCLSSHMHYWQVGFDSLFVSNDEVLILLKKMNSINFAQNNHFISERSTVPNDPSIGSQWHHVNTGSGGGTVDADIDSDLAWDITTGGLTADGDTIVIALVEGGGAFYNHTDLQSNFWRNYMEVPGNSIDDDANGYIDDFEGWDVNSANDNHSTGSHGTSCFGMMGATGNNSIGVTGINWNVKVMLVSGFGVDEAGVIAAYDYPLTMRKMYNQTNGSKGAFVVATSASWGIDFADPLSYPLWCGFYDTLGVYGILNVGATTNSTVDVDAVGDMPTACSSPYMVSVTRTGNTDNQAGGFGLTTIDFGAPGISIYTTSGSSTSSYTTTTGTSFSCPLTAGTIALMYSVPCSNLMNLVKNDPQGGADYILNTLLNGTDPKPSLAGKSVTGGRLNAFNSVNTISSTCATLTIQSTDIDSEIFNLYPNPANSIVYINTSQTIESITRVELVNINGKIVKTFCFESEKSEFQIPLEEISTGLYGIIIHTSKSNYFQKLIIHK